MSRHTVAMAPRLPAAYRPADDEVFPIAHARRYAAALRDARVVEIADSYSFVPEDQPAALARAVASAA